MTNNEEIVEQEKNIIFSCLRYLYNNSFNFNDPQSKKILKDSIKKIFQIEMEKIGEHYDPNNIKNNTVLLYLNDSTNLSEGINEAGNFKEPNTIEINLFEFYKKIFNESDITLNFVFVEEIFQTMFHEIRHLRQYKMTQCTIGSKKSLQYARDFALAYSLSKTWYKKNYKTMFIENDANEVGTKELNRIFGRAVALDEWEFLEEKARKEKYTGQYIVNDQLLHTLERFYSSGLEERDEITIPILDYLICKKDRIEILERYPILKKEYNLDGTKKSSKELISNLRKELDDISKENEFPEDIKKEAMQDCKEMYFELINRQIESNPLKEVNEIIAEFGKDDCINILDELAQYFNKEKESKIQVSENFYSKWENVPEIKKENNNHKRISKRLEEYYGEKQNFLFNIIKAIEKHSIIKEGDIKREKLSKVQIDDKTELELSEFIENLFNNDKTSSAENSRKDNNGSLSQSLAPKDISELSISNNITYQEIELGKMIVEKIKNIFRGSKYNQR